MVAIDGFSLLDVESRGVGVDAGHLKSFDHLVHREDIAIGGNRPPQERQIIQQALFDESPIAVKEQV